MISLAATQFDIDGAVLIPSAQDRSKVEERVRRVKRTATLDGAASFTDFGFSDADRTLILGAENISQSVFDAVARLLETHALVSVSTRTGVFEAALASISLQNGDFTVHALVKQKVSI